MFISVPDSLIGKTGKQLLEHVCASCQIAIDDVIRKWKDASADDAPDAILQAGPFEVLIPLVTHTRTSWHASMSWHSDGRVFVIALNSCFASKNLYLYVTSTRMGCPGIAQVRFLRRALDSPHGRARAPALCWT